MDTNKHFVSNFVSFVRKEDMMKKLAPYLIPNLGTLIILGLFFAASATGAMPLRDLVAAPSTTMISYQGQLTDPDGTPLTGTYDMHFALYDAPTGGTACWTEPRTGANAVPVSDGLFNVLLGNVRPIAPSCLTGDVYLGITVGSDSEMTPRELLGSVPHALQANTVPDGSITTAKIADGAVEGTKLGTSFGAIEGPLYNVVMRPGRIWALNVNNGGDVPTTSLDLSGSVSPSATAVLLNMRFQDSGSPSTATYFQVCKKDSVECFDLYMQESGHPVERFVIVQSVNRQIDYTIGASGSNTAGYRLEVWGCIEPAAQ